MYKIAVFRMIMVMGSQLRWQQIWSAKECHNQTIGAEAIVIMSPFFLPLWVASIKKPVYLDTGQTALFVYIVSQWQHKSWVRMFCIVMFLLKTLINMYRFFNQNFDKKRS